MTEKYTRRAALGVLCGVVLAASVRATAGLAQGLSVKHSRGELTLKSIPKKVIVFDLAALDTLDTLGVEVMGVAGSLFPSYLAKYEGSKSIKVGSLFEPNYEAVHIRRRKETPALSPLAASAAQVPGRQAISWRRHSGRFGKSDGRCGQIKPSWLSPSTQKPRRSSARPWPIPFASASLRVHSR